PGAAATAQVWFSPNMPGAQQPPSATAHPKPPPPDMDQLFHLMRQARDAILFLVFLPSRGGRDSVVSTAVDLGLHDSALTVIGAIPDSQAMWGAKAASTTPDGKKIPAWSPHVFVSGGVSVVRATALSDKDIERPLGDFRMGETLKEGNAI